MSVMLAYLTTGTVSHSFMDSVLRVSRYQVDNDPENQITCRLPIMSGPHMLDFGRDAAVREFLKSDTEWLWFFDTDMGCESDAVANLIANGEPVVGAWALAMQASGDDDCGGFRAHVYPTLYERGATPNGYARMDVVQNTGPIAVDATGAACLLIRRDVAQRVMDKFGTCFRMKDMEDSRMGEDISFCSRLGELGIPITVDTDVKTTHHKRVWIG